MNKEQYLQYVDDLNHVQAVREMQFIKNEIKVLTDTIQTLHEKLIVIIDKVTQE